MGVSSGGGGGVGGGGSFGLGTLTLLREGFLLGTLCGGSISLGAVLGRLGLLIELSVGAMVLRLVSCGTGGGAMVVDFSAKTVLARRLRDCFLLVNAEVC